MAAFSKKLRYLSVILAVLTTFWTVSAIAPQDSCQYDSKNGVCMGSCVDSDEVCIQIDEGVCSCVPTPTPGDDGAGGSGGGAGPISVSSLSPIGIIVLVCSLGLVALLVIRRC